MKNKYMLWHGTDIAHVMSILRNGLQIAPHNSIRSGNSYGKVSAKKCSIQFLVWSKIPGWIFNAEIISHT